MRRRVDVDSEFVRQWVVSVTIPEVAAVINTADADLWTEITAGPDFTLLKIAVPIVS